jgi:hypothetical protein
MLTSHPLHVFPHAKISSVSYLARLWNDAARSHVLHDRLPLAENLAVRFQPGLPVEINKPLIP